MEMHQIIYFLRVAKELHMTRAAEALHVAQPSLSRQIRLLEEELDVLLFERLPKGLRLTPAGEALQAHLGTVLAQVEATRQVVAPFTQGVQGLVRIGCLPSLAAHLLPRLLTNFLREHPGVQTRVQVLGTSRAIADHVRDGDVDLGLGELADPELEHLTLGDDPLLVALPPHLLPAAAGPVSLRELATLPLVLTTPDCTVRRRLEAALPQPLHPVLEVEQLEAALRFAATGVGAAVVPESLATAAQVDVRLLPLAPALTRPLYLLWRRESFLTRTHPLLRALAATGGNE